MAKITIIEAMKTKKRLNKKLEDLREKISRYCVHMDNENPVYPDQEKRVQGWVQAHRDIVKKIEDLTIAIQKTNLNREVEISLGGHVVKKTIAQWILRRQQLASAEEACYKRLSDRNLRDQDVLLSDGKNRQKVSVVRYFDPVKRDEMIDMFRHEPSMIDSKLEVVNATTTLVEDVDITETD